jgi:pimeloyl-ACP methyl ester carboxylesterase
MNLVRIGVQRDIAGSKLVLFDHCGHAPQIECAQSFEFALESFLTL